MSIRRVPTNGINSLRHRTRGLKGFPQAPILIPSSHFSLRPAKQAFDSTWSNPKARFHASHALPLRDLFPSHPVRQTIDTVLIRRVQDFHAFGPDNEHDGESIRAVPFDLFTSTIEDRAQQQIGLDPVTGRM